MKRNSTYHKQQQLLAQLEERRSTLQQQLMQQQQANLDLKASAFLLTSLCDSLSVRHRLKAYHQSASQETVVQQLLALLESERGLLQQLHGLQGTPQPAPAPIAGLQQPTIAPPNDPVAYLRHLLSEPALAQEPTADARGLYAQMVQGVAIQVNQHRDGLVTEAAASASIQPLIDRCARVTHTTGPLSLTAP